MNFKVLNKCVTSRARLCELETAHGGFETPAFMPVGTQGSVKAVSPEELEEIGYAMAIYPALTGLAAAAAIENALKLLKTEGTSKSPSVPLFNFSEFNKLIGFEEVWEFERRWARDGKAAAE